MSKKTILIIALALIVVFLVFVVFFSKDNESGTSTTEQSGTRSTSEEESAQSDFTLEPDDNDNKSINDPGNSLPEDKGRSSVSNNSSQPTENNEVVHSSEDGNTAIYSPQEESKISTGTIISGKTSNSNIFYRLIDNKTGVIGEGELSINYAGYFSATITVETSGTEGRLDIFSRDNDSVEHSNIYIEVKF